MMSHVLAFGMPSMGEWVVVAIIGLLFFGKRLPEVGRSLGKGIVEFKKGLKGIEDDIDDQVDAAAEKQRTTVTRLPDQQAKFDPYTGKPIAEAPAKFDPYTGKPLENGEPENREPVTTSSSSDHA